MKNIIVKDLKQLLEIIAKHNSDGQKWFRGQSNSNYRLLPSAYRNLYAYEDQFGRPKKPELVTSYNNSGDNVFLPDIIYLETFFKYLDTNNISYDKNLNLVDKYCLAQHYGVWTPMMDWTTDATVAMHFAMSGRKKGNKTALYILNPISMNEKFIGKNTILDSAQVIEESKILPVAMYGGKYDKRMCRQSGNFTVHGNMIWPLDHYKDSDEFLLKIEISQRLSDEIRMYLLAFGINDDSIYVSKDIKDDIAKEARKINEIDIKKILDEKFNEWEKTPPEDRANERHFG
ncbi:FRG domain-containing protein [Clostridium sp.]|uniref:FRG domain-containing protein n=1 Tax=Clostridium sp. TaxID=1506 RepID=UPI0028479843|nr:FRG domain-containing protein [Clostridium sp.]MDR3594920.1 FRG domain-containing protein [Clostridium sp.]